MIVSRGHLKQFTQMAVVGVIALGIGSLMKADASPETFLSPSPVASQITPTPSPVASPVIAAYVQPSISPAPTIKKAPSPTPIATQSKKNPMTWGITLHLLPFPDGNEPLIPTQFKLAKELGVSTVRVDYSVTNAKLNQMAVAEAKKNGLNLIFIIPFGDIDIFTDPHVTERTTAMVKRIVAEHKNDIHIWQLGNEVANVAIRQGEDLYGIDRSDYPEDRYKAVATWLKAAQAAVKVTDPTAKTLVTDAYVHTGFFDRFFSEGGDFDILGWDWYSWISDDLNSVPLEGRPGRYRLLTKLKSYNKELWLTEVSRHLGSYGENQLDRQEEQAQVIESVAKQAIDSGAITGYFVYNLIQDQTVTENLRAFGIVNVDRENKKITGVKAAFKRYQQIIQQNR